MQCRQNMGHAAGFSFPICFPYSKHEEILYKVYNISGTSSVISDVKFEFSRITYHTRFAQGVPEDF